MFGHMVVFLLVLDELYYKDFSYSVILIMQFRIILNFYPKLHTQPNSKNGKEEEIEKSLELNELKTEIDGSLKAKFQACSNYF